MSKISIGDTIITTFRGAPMYGVVFGEFVSISGDRCLEIWPVVNGEVYDSAGESEIRRESDCTRLNPLTSPRRWAKPARVGDAATKE